jgi:hypothetical protein
MNHDRYPDFYVRGTLESKPWIDREDAVARQASEFGSLRMRVLLVFFLVLGLTGAAGAFSESDRAAIESTIERQLQAFLADDAATAYSFAAPGIQAMFPTQDVFMDMVRRGYAAVYRPQSYAFCKLEETAAGMQQIVDIIDSEGVQWTALYTLAQQPDGS